MQKNETVFLVSPKIVMRKEGREALLFHPGTGDSDFVNETGVFILRLCDGKHREEEIVSKAVRNYGGQREDIAADIRSFLKEMMQAGVVEAASPKKSPGTKKKK